MSDNIKIYTYNILNPDINVSNLLFRNTQTGNFKEIIENSKKIAEIDLIRYKLYRKQKIIEMVESWLADDSVVCLQEVPADLLSDLKKKYKTNLSHTNSLDKISFNTYNLNKSQKNTITKYEYRVTIVSKNLNIIKSREIEMQNFNMRKNALYTKIKFNDNFIQCVNLHLHWKNTADDMDIFSRYIVDSLDNSVFVICGDYNKVFTSKYMAPFINNIKIDNMSDLNNNHNKFTSFSTIDDKTSVKIYKNIKNNPTSDMTGSFIDYFIIGNSNGVKYANQTILDSHNFNLGNSSKKSGKMSNKKGDELLYYLPRLADNTIIDMDNPDIDKMSKKWIDMNIKSKMIDLSDHKPVMIELRFDNLIKKTQTKPLIKSGKRGKKVKVKK